MRKSDPPPAVDATAFLNARLIDPASGRDEPGGLLVRGGVIADLGAHLRRNAPDGAAVIDGPTPRSLAALPLRLADGKLVVAKPFTGRVGIMPT